MTNYCTVQLYIKRKRLRYIILFGRENSCDLLQFISHFTRNTLNFTEFRAEIQTVSLRTQPLAKEKDKNIDQWASSYLD